MGLSWQEFHPIKRIRLWRYLRLLNKLEPDAIAGFLSKWGYTGNVFKGRECPVAKFLSAQLGYGYIAATFYCYGPDGLFKVNTPPNVAEFMCRFDEGKYPELEEPVDI